MTIARLYLLDLGVTLVVSILVVAYLRGHLKSILTDLCGTPERASFWTAFSIVTLVLVPLIFAMNYQPELESSASAVFEAAQQIKWALIGLVVSVLLLGVVIGSFIPRSRTATSAASTPR